MVLADTHTALQYETVYQALKGIQHIVKKKTCKCPKIRREKFILTRKRHQSSRKCTLLYVKFIIQQNVLWLGLGSVQNLWSTEARHVKFCMPILLGHTYKFVANGQLQILRQGAILTLYATYLHYQQKFAQEWIIKLFFPKLPLSSIGFVELALTLGHYLEVDPCCHHLCSCQKELLH